MIRLRGTHAVIVGSAALAALCVLALLALAGPRSASADLDVSVSSPSSVDAVANGSNIDVTWSDDGNDPSILKGYLIHDNGEYAAFVSASSRSHTITGLADGSTHTIEVRAQNRASDWSNPVAAAEVTIGGGGEQPPVVEGETTRIRNRNSDKCADVEDFSLADGVKVQQWTCHSGANQQFSIRPVGDGYHELVAAHSGKCIEVVDGSSENGARVSQADCSQRWRQLFSFVDVGDGFRQIVARHSEKCLDVAGISVDDFARIQQWECKSTGNLNQDWSFSGGDGPGPGDVYRCRVAASEFNGSLVVDTTQNSTSCDEYLFTGIGAGSIAQVTEIGAGIRYCNASGEFCESLRLYGYVPGSAELYQQLDERGATETLIRFETTCTFAQCVDAPFDPPTASGCIWLDADRDGLRDPGEGPPPNDAVWGVFVGHDGKWVDGLNIGADGCYEYETGSFGGGQDGCAGPSWVFPNGGYEITAEGPGWSWCSQSDVVDSDLGIAPI